jgi:GT2 family glycosyltransferase
VSRKQIKGRVSIVVTNHNRQAYIVPCLESLFRQSYPHIEIVVVDDQGRITEKNPSVAQGLA